MKPNGTAVIALNEEEKILCVPNDAQTFLVLPGGGLGRGATPAHSAAYHLFQKSGIVALESGLCLIGVFTQRVVENGEERDFGGLLCLYTCEYFGGKPNQNAKFLSAEEIVALYDKSEFGRAYVRMVLHHENIARGLLKPVLQGRLADPVPYLPQRII